MIHWVLIIAMGWGGRSITSQKIDGFNKIDSCNNSAQDIMSKTKNSLNSLFDSSPRLIWAYCLKVDN